MAAVENTTARRSITDIASQVASATTNRRAFSGFDEAWVQSEGVPGKPAPSSRDKYPLWTAKVCKTLNIQIPDGMPSGDVKVGKHCPVCAHRGVIPAENWYYHPNDPEFVANGSREKPEGKKNCGFMHRHTLCTYMWMMVHKHVKANPSDMHLFDRLPEGQDPSFVN